MRFEDPAFLLYFLGLTLTCWLRIIEVNSAIAKARDQNPDVGRDSDGVLFSDPLHISPHDGGPVSLDLQMFPFSPGTVSMCLSSRFHLKRN